MTDKHLLKLDHITVVAETLAAGSAYIKDALGIDMPDGGAHPRMGTHNQLMALGHDLFLELIAIDPNAAKPAHPRWFDLDRFTGEPQLSTWVLGTDDILTTLTQAHADSGQATEITRGDLKWLISIAPDGTMPLDGAFPTLIEWPDTPHPASNMTDLNCRLKTLLVEHPEAQAIKSLIGHRIDQETIQITQGAQKKMTAIIETPTGTKTLT